MDYKRHPDSQTENSDTDESTLTSELRRPVFYYDLVGIMKRRL